MSSFSYKYKDSSVPPPFHRSYSIILINDTIQLSIDSYGDILAEKEYPLPENAFDTIKQLIQEYDISLRKVEVKNDGCTGGTSESISFLGHKEDENFSGRIYYCGSKQYGTLAGDVKSFSTAFKKAFVPDLKEIIRSTK